MKKKGELLVPKKDDVNKCPVCGGEINADTGKCSVCGEKPPEEKKDGGKRLQISMVKDISSKQISDPKNEKKKTGDSNGGKPKLATEPSKVSDEDKALAKWLSGDSEKDALGDWLGGEPEPAKEGKVQKPDADKKDNSKKKEVTSKKDGPKDKKKSSGDDEGDDALKKWLSGEEDTLADWLGDEEEKKPDPFIIEPVGKELVEREKILNEREMELDQKQEEIEGLKLEMAEFKKVMESEFKKVKSGDFDPLVILEETARLNKELQGEIKKRKLLEEEIVQVKKGSLAVIKYVKSQKGDSGGVAKSLKKKVEEDSELISKLEAEMKAKNSLIDELKQQIEKGLDSLPDDAKDLKRLELELLEKEKNLEAQLEAFEEREKAMEKKLQNGASSSEADSDLQQRMMAELNQKEQEFIEKEAEMKKNILDLEEKIKEFEIDNKLRSESKELEGKSDTEINKELDRKVRELQVKEKSLLLREDEIQRLKEKLRSTEDEMKKIREPLAYKEEELLRRDEDLIYREQLLTEERRKLEEAMRESGSMESHEMKKKLEELQNEINRKEDELRAKEKYIMAKTEDLRIREQGLISDEIDAKEEDRMLELKIEKVKTGDRRLDDLLLGGIPFGNNILVYGPPFTGKEVVINGFIAEGLRKGIPAIWVITDKMPSEIREEMMFILQGYEEYEKMGLVRYVDAYSRSIGVDDVEPNVTYIDEATDFKEIEKAVDDIAKDLLKEHKYYRLGFRSISTLIAYLDSASAFKFLQPFCGRRKRDRAVAFFSIEKGMHDDQDIQMIGSVTDGIIDFKLESLKTYLSIRGLGDVQSRAWIDYTYSKKGLVIGSFSLDHIR